MERSAVESLVIGSACIEKKAVNGGNISNRKKDAPLVATLLPTILPEITQFRTIIPKKVTDSSPKRLAQELKMPYIWKEGSHVVAKMRRCHCQATTVTMMVSLLLVTNIPRLEQWQKLIGNQTDVERWTAWDFPFLHQLIFHLEGTYCVGICLVGLMIHLKDSCVQHLFGHIAHHHKTLMHYTRRETQILLKLRLKTNASMILEIQMKVMGSRMIKQLIKFILICHLASKKFISKPYAPTASDHLFPNFIIWVIRTSGNFFHVKKCFQHWSRSN
mmetsp:Transcript_17176/g.25534  ORF Transcript_17176/g.25534 Transcript_17176/m.25534 type:complete len:274 (+) Transcript_17176:1333-2154(+)